MSSDNLISENRNSLNNIGPIQEPTNRIRNLRNIIRSETRCCSFCRLPGHTISWCNDQRIIDFENLCLHQKSLFENNEFPQQEFENWLLDYYTTNQNIVKVFSVRKCGSTTRASISVCLDNIMQYFYGEYYDIPDLVNESDSNTNTNMNDDFIPFNMNDDFIQFNDLIPIYTRVNNWENISDSMISAILRPTGTYRDRNRKFNITSSIENTNEQNTNEQDTNEQNTNEQNTNEDCNICYESVNITNFVKLNCQHELCKDCCKKTLQICGIFQDPSCAFCREKIENLTFKNESDKSEFKDLIV